MIFDRLNSFLDTCSAKMRKTIENAPDSSIAPRVSFMAHGYTYRNPRVAFDEAIAEKRLSANPRAANYAGNYMYMQTDAMGIDQFKHVDTRSYLAE